MSSVSPIAFAPGGHGFAFVDEDNGRRYAGDLVATLRKALTQLQTNGNAPSDGVAYALNPADAEKLDLLHEGTGTGTYLLGGPGGPTAQDLWQVPRVTSTAVTAGTAWLGNWDFAQLIVREDATVAIDTSGTNFSTNQAVMRVEGRFGWACKRA